MMVNQSLLLLQPPLNLGANSLTPEQHSSTLSSSSSSPLDGDASASSTSSSMLVAGVRVRLGTTGLEKNYEDRLHPTSSSLTTEPESELAGCLTGTGTDPAKKSLWYRQMYKQLHCLDDEDNHQGGKDKSVLKYHQQKEQPKMYGRRYQRPTTPTWRLESSSQRSAASSNWSDAPGVRRSKSQPRQPYRYDPVADMEILDRWKWQQQNQKHSTSNHSLNNVTKPKTSIQFEEDYNGGSERSTAKPCVSFQDCADSLPPKPPRSSHASVHPHLHLPPYRLADQKRCLCFNLPCTSLTPFRHCREHTQEQIDQLYKLVGPANMDVYCKQEKLYEKLKLRHMEERMDKTTKELDALLGQIERFSKFAGQRSKSSVAISRRPSNHLNGLHSSREEGSVSSVLTSKDNLLQKQKIDKLCEELEDQLARKHGYLPSSTPSLQNNFDRFDHLMHSFAVGNRSRSGSETPMSNTSSRPVQTCTTLYTFVSQSPRELSLNKGDVVRLNRQLDDNWWEGERNGQVGIFPASYVQLDESTSKDRLKAIYAFRARNPNELSLNRGDTLEYLRSIDQHWLEGRNSKGQVGIFPRSYVQKEDSKSGEKPFKSSISFAVEGEVNGTPDRPKTPKIIVGNSNGGRWVVQTFNLSKVLHF